MISGTCFVFAGVKFTRHIIRWERKNASILFVPVVNLMDVSEDDLVFSPHVIRDSFLLHPAHVALRVGGSGPICKTSSKR